MTSESRIVSDLPIPPGEFLEEVIEDLGMTKDELATRMNRPAAKLSAIYGGSKAITPETAGQLETVTGVSARVWLGLQADYDLARQMQREKADVVAIKEEAASVPAYCYAALAKLGLVPKTTDREEKVRNLRDFFGVTSLRKLPEVKRYAPAYRFGANQKRQPSPEALNSWLRIGELQAQKIDCAPFDKKRLERHLQEIRSLSKENPEDSIPRLREILQDCGVALVLCPHLPKTYAQGAVFKLRNKYVLMLTLRCKWADIFWFSLFHELGHIIKHGNEAALIDLEGPSGDAQKEAEANKFAADWLIPSQAYHAFIADGRFSQTVVEAFAEGTDIHPGIVVGRLQNEGKLRHDCLNGLRSRYEWSRD